MISPTDLFWLLVQEFFLVVPFSYIWFGDTWIYNIAENTLIGSGVAFAFFSLTNTLNSSCFNFVAAGDWTMIIPLILGILVFSRFTKFRWLSRYAVSLLAGLGVGVAFGTTISAQILGQVNATVTGIVKGSPDPISSILALIGVVTVVSYFLYTARISMTFHTGRLRYISEIGRLFLFASFGYLFVTDTYNHESGPFLQLAVREFLTKLGILA